MASFGFVINTYHDTAQLAACLSSLRQHYPDAPATVIDDGGDGTAIIPVTAEYRADLMLGQHLRHAVGKWLRRWLAAGLGMGTDWVVKVDPDSRFHRPFTAPPDAPAIGYPIQSWYGHYLHGGCKAYSRGCARRLVAVDDIAQVDELIDDQLAHALRGFKHPLSEDLVLSWFLWQLDIPQSRWAEISPVPMAPHRGYAVSHGHRLPDGGTGGLKP